MKKILLLPGLLSLIICFGQDETVKKLQSETAKAIKKDPSDTIPKTWKKGGLYSLNVSQGSLSNWAAGVFRCWQKGLELRKAGASISRGADDPAIGTI